MLPHELLALDFEQCGPAYTLDEVCEICDVTVDRVVSLVEFGVLKPEGCDLDEWRFPAYSIIQARRAHRLQRDLELDLPGLALTLDLLEEIGDLRRELQRLRAQVDQFLPDI